MMLLILLITLGIIAFFVRRPQQAQPKIAEPEVFTPKVFITPQQQHLLNKVRYASDADRIREMNLLSPNASKFLRLLRQTFSNHNVVVKAQRFFVVNAEGYPVAIFEYRDGTVALKSSDFEDGLPVFFYKAMLSSEALKADAAQVLAMPQVAAVTQF